MTGGYAFTVDIYSSSKLASSSINTLAVEIGVDVFDILNWWHRIGVQELKI